MEKKIQLQDLAELLATREKISIREAENFVRAFFEITEEGLLQESYVKVSGFGTMKLIEVSQRESVNINTGERFRINGHTKISFTPDNTLRDLVNHPFADLTTITLNDDTPEEEIEKITDSSDTESSEASDSLKSEENGDILSTSTQAKSQIPEQDLPSTEKRQQEEPLTAEKNAQKETEEVSSSKASSTNEIEQKWESSHSEENKEEVNSISETVSTVAEKIDFLATQDVEGDISKKQQTANSEAKNLQAGSILPQGNTAATEREKEKTKQTVATSASLPKEKQSVIVHSSKRQKTPGSYWKTAFWVLLIAVLLLLFYLSGYYHWFPKTESLFNSCSNKLEKVTSKNEHEVSHTSMAVDSAPPPSIEVNPTLQQSPKGNKATAATPRQQNVPSTQKDSHSNQRASTSGSVKAEQLKREEKAREMVAAQQHAAGRREGNAARPIDTRHQAALQAQRAETARRKAVWRKSRKYQQLPGGTMLIVGTRGSHRLKVGENLYRLAQQTYGNRSYAQYIILYNKIENPDFIGVNKKIYLPKLVNAKTLK